VDLVINDKMIAKGEVAVIDENFAVRIVTLLSPEERLKLL
jgi:flagellar motor switch protein FliN/FliY